MSSKVQSSHRDMYKSRTPPWKDTYRKRCLERLRASREKLKDRFRQLPATKNNNHDNNNDEFIEDLMRSELEHFRSEQEKSAEEEFEGGGVSANFNIDEMLDMFEDIQNELRQEELHMMEQYGDYDQFEAYRQSLQREEESLCSAIDKLSTQEVLCPLCKKHTLLTNKSVIFCVCGLRINTEQDCMTLSNVKQMLDRGLDEHSQQCERMPDFSVVNATGASNLIMACPDCDWMSIVI